MLTIKPRIQAVIKTTSILLILITIFAFVQRTAETTKHSDLLEWGLNGRVKVLKAFYYDSIEKTEERMDSINPGVWSRMTIAYYNRAGNIDSLKTFNARDEAPLIFIYTSSGDTSSVSLVKEKDTTLFSKKFWTSKHQYSIEILNNDSVECKERYVLSPEFRIEEIRREHYNIKNETIAFTTSERIHFNQQNQLDSIQSFSNDQLDAVTLNFDLEFDEKRNPTRSIKKVDGKKSYLINREFVYY